MEHLLSREVFHPLHVMDWYTIRKFLLHRLPTSRDKSSLLQYLSGNNLTPAWLHTHGWVIDHKCPCGEIDNIGHWLAGCPAREAHQEAHPVGEAKLLETISWQPPPVPSRPFFFPAKVFRRWQLRQCRTVSMAARPTHIHRWVLLVR